MANLFLMPEQNLVVQHEATPGWEVQVYIAAMAPRQQTSPVVTDPSGLLQVQTLEVGAADVAQGSTTITLAANLSQDIQIGQVHRWVTVEGFEFISVLTQKALAGTNQLTVGGLNAILGSVPGEGIPETIPAGAKACAIAYLWDRSNADITPTYQNEETKTFNTGLGRDAVPTGGNKDGAASGIAYYYNAGSHTAHVAAELGRYIWVVRMEPPPNDSYRQGLVHMGRALLSQQTRTAPQSGKISDDLSWGWQGAVRIIHPIPV